MIGVIQRMLALEPEKRLDVRSFMDSEYFGEITFRSLMYLTGLIEKEDSTKIQFLKGLYQGLKFSYIAYLFFI